MSTVWGGRGTREDEVTTTSWRGYATCWTVAAGAVFAASLVLGGRVMGWFPVLLLAGLMAVLGACFGVAWHEDPVVRRRVATAGAGWGAFGIVLVLGLPPTLGPWGLVVGAGLAASSPWTILCVRRELRRRGSRRLPDVDLISDHELARRWELTGQALRDPRRTAAERVAVVEDRVRLLDELERRDPRAFESWLTREGWLAPAESAESAEG
jgi:hypothetical protein